MRQLNQKTLWRGGIYALGVVLVCIGVAMSSRLALGVATVCAPPYSISEKFGFSFSTMLLVLYLLMVAAEFVMKGKQREKRDLLQIPISFAFSAVMGWMEVNLFAALDENTFAVRLALYVLAVITFSVGSALMIPMRLIPNPADGFTDAVRIVTKKDLGFAKNLVDAACVLVGILLDLVLHGTIISIGIGTLIAMVLSGRVIAVFNRIFLQKMLRLSSLDGQ